MIPKESDGEHFEDALARVCRCVGGGAADNADSDSDLEVVADSFAVSLRCPVSYTLTILYCDYMLPCECLVLQYVYVDKMSNKFYENWYSSSKYP